MRYRLFAVAVFIDLFSAACTNGKMRFMDQRMGFFITSTGFSDAAGLAIGGSFGGIDAADQKCRNLASAAGEFSHKTWRAYLSYHAGAGVGNFANAYDRIGNGPWYNAAGQIFSQDLKTLHAAPPAASLFLTEKGTAVAATEYMLTGSDADGILKFNCGSYTRNDSGALMSLGLPAGRWNYEKDIDCQAATFQSQATTGRFYCFATD